MATYRISRNIEASLIDYITTALSNAGWTNITVEKGFKRIYDIPVKVFTESGAICVRVETTEHDSAEVGTDNTIRTPHVFIDIFGANDGQRLDLKDFLISAIKGGLPYCEYVVNGNTVTTKTQNGRLRVLTMDDQPVSFNIDKSSLEDHDKYRHLITVTLSLGRVEA